MADLNSEQLLDQMASSCWKEEKAVHCHPPVRVGSANFNEVPQFQVKSLTDSWSSFWLGSQPGLGRQFGFRTLGGNLMSEVSDAQR